MPSLVVVLVIRVGVVKESAGILLRINVTFNLRAHVAPRILRLQLLLYIHVATKANCWRQEYLYRAVGIMSPSVIDGHVREHFGRMVARRDYNAV